jgi:hypothetical protein
MILNSGERLLGIAALAALTTFAAALRLLFAVFVATAFATAIMIVSAATG